MDVPVTIRVGDVSITITAQAKQEQKPKKPFGTVLVPKKARRYSVPRTNQNIGIQPVVRNLILSSDFFDEPKTAKETHAKITEAGFEFKGTRRKQFNSVYNALGLMKRQDGIIKTVVNDGETSYVTNLR